VTSDLDKKSCEKAVPELNQSFAELWKQCVRLTLPYWSLESRVKAWLLLFFVLLLIGANTALSVTGTYVYNHMVTALSNKDAAAFAVTVQQRFIIYAGTALLQAYLTYSVFLLALNWRQWLTKYFLRGYMQNRAFFKINSEAGIDNPDERMSEDIENFTLRLSDLISVFIDALVQLFSYGFVLYQICAPLLGATVACAWISIFATWLLGRRLISIQFQQRKKEADFRFGLIHMRTQAEPIALYKGAPYVLKGMMQRFRTLVENNLLLLRTTRTLELFTRNYEWMPVMLVPQLFLLHSLLRGHLSLGDYTQAESAFAIVCFALSRPVSMFTSLAEFSAMVRRLAELQARLSRKSESTSPSSQITMIEGDRIELRDFSLMTPDRNRLLISGLSFRINRGQSLAVVGPTGSGKSSLLRAISGLWTEGSGVVVCPAVRHLLFLPQKPYLIPGSLREQLAFPKSEYEYSDDVLVSALGQVNLNSLLEQQGGLDSAKPWTKILSPGQQQLLSIVRATLFNPEFVFLDECTSALDLEDGKRVYELIKKRRLSFLSICHAKELLPYHDFVLELKGDSSWSLSSFQEYLTLKGLEP